MSDAKRDIERGIEYPYGGYIPLDWADRAALGICLDLSDRRGIKHELEQVDDDIAREIVASMAAIIRAAKEADK